MTGICLSVAEMNARLTTAGLSRRRVFVVGAMSYQSSLSLLSAAATARLVRLIRTLAAWSVSASASARVVPFAYYCRPNCL